MSIFSDKAMQNFEREALSYLGDVLLKKLEQVP